ncbi:uncharacterized protein LOC143459192 isoform X1 [Clavelina lepadiformis]|uniref:uncharacterized protein LOC143459192 isoform X1 n=1 Tax=Clavelina lepadiformis TaxID=159417 RepID=UPI0040413085
MKVVMAGYSKTGTKSMAAALRLLGYKVYDFMDHFWYHYEDWMKIMERQSTVEDFRRMYQDVDALTGCPAFAFWEEILKAFPDAKVTSQNTLFAGIQTSTFAEVFVFKIKFISGCSDDSRGGKLVPEHCRPGEGAGELLQVPTHANSHTDWEKILQVLQGSRMRRKTNYWCTASRRDGDRYVLSLARTFLACPSHTPTLEESTSKILWKCIRPSTGWSESGGGFSSSSPRWDSTRATRSTAMAGWGKPPISSLTLHEEDFLVFISLFLKTASIHFVHG